jgi:hypothetical protein
MSPGVHFEKKAQKIERVWALVATHPTGQQEDVIGFHTFSQEVAEKQWIPRMASNERLSRQTR